DCPALLSCHSACNMDHDVFISYSSKDKDDADAVCHHLEDRGIKCWIAPRDIDGGKCYSESICDGVEQASILLLTLSANSNVSAGVASEVEIAFRNRKTIIPFRIENVLPSKKLLFFVSSVHWLDAFPLSPESLDRLADSIFRKLGRQVQDS